MGKRYTLFDDPGHAWLEVPQTEIDELGIADQISRCSYVNNGSVYLEEDCDLSVFIRAMFPNRGGESQAEVQTWFTNNVRRVHQEITPIRNYDRYLRRTP